ncbi:MULTISPECIES: alpha/beta family hydrolase [Mumia]|uniref:alpha/beta hydrolase family protein n=1 Tax=Mumia TaxID=1546255 RepID=UPI0014221772|nr:MULTISPECIES: alpha/beta family hydrolase [unclassified Mumia]QMW67407.1 hydrolase [Mumia sp. ZJ1417]
MTTLSEATYDTPYGPGRIVARRSDRPWAVLVLTHGAGGGIESHDLEVLTAGLPKLGVGVVRIEMPWRTAGKRIASAPSVLDASFTSLVDHLRPRVPLFIGGRSAGARVACRRGRALGAVGVVALAFPLHPPGRPERSRADELLGAGVPTLVVQGERDTFGTPAEFPLGTSMVVLPGADHSLKVAKRAEPDQAAVDALLVEGVHEFLHHRVGRSGTAGE